MEEFLKTHNPKYLQQYISKSTLPKGELSTLSSALMTKYGNNASYGDVIQTANYEYTVNYKGAGEFDIIEYHQIDNEKYERINDKENKGFRGSLDRLSSRDEFTESKYPISDYNVTDRETTGNNANLDKQTSQGKSNQTSNNASSSQHQEWSEIKRDSATGRITFVDGDGRTVSSPEDWKGIETFTTPQGEVYGFVDKDGNIYLDETKISPEHPIHEYTHLWDRTVQKHNPKLWNRGVELMKQSSLWNDVLNDEHYGKQWQSMNLPKERLENLIASEVHARIVGENGEKLLNNIAKRNGQSGIVAKLKQWVLDMWKEVKATFGSWSKEDLDALTLNDFNHMTVRDFVDSTNLKEININENLPTSDTAINIYAGTNENADLSNFANRPFSVTNVGEEASGPVAGNFNTVEGAFQAQKLFYSNLSEKEQQVLLQQLEKASGSQARIIGRRISGLDRATWDKVSSSLMYNLLLDSFRQNPKAAERLLATGNATLTHKQDKGKWGKEFPKLLMEVREELNNKQLLNNGTEQQSNRFKTVNEVWENLGGYFEGAGLNINKDFPNASKENISTLEDNYMAPDRYPLSNEQIIEIGNRIVNSNTINNGTKEYKTTDEFRRVQEASRKLSEKGTSKYNKGETTLTDKDRERIGRLLGRLLESNSNGSWYGVQSHLTHVNKDGKTGSFNVGKVDGKLFHDIFGTVRTYLRNGELVDLHKDYSDCKCFVTDDGLCGFAIEPNGNLVSVFSLTHIAAIHHVTP